MQLLDPNLFETLERIRTAGEKVAFSPSPGIQQATMAQAQGGMPPGGDPAAAAGGMPPGGAMPPGAPPPGDPATGGGPPPDAATPSMPDPQIAEIKQMLMQMTQGGGMGANGKPATASLKFEPQHFHTLVHKINNIEAVLTQMADQFGLQVPASELLNQSTAPGPSTPGQDPAAGGAPDPGGQPAPGGAPAAGAGIAQQLPNLPSLPPAAAKAAQALDVARSAVDVERLGRLGTGFVVGGADSPKGGTATAKLAAFVARRGL